MGLETGDPEGGEERGRRQGPGEGGNAGGELSSRGEERVLRAPGVGVRREARRSGPLTPGPDKGPPKDGHRHKMDGTGAARPFVAGDEREQALRSVPLPLTGFSIPCGSAEDLIETVLHFSFSLRPFRLLPFSPKH